MKEQNFLDLCECILLKLSKHYRHKGPSLSKHNSEKKIIEHKKEIQNH